MSNPTTPSLVQEGAETAASLDRSGSSPQHAAAQLESLFGNALALLCIAGFDGYFQRLSPAWAATLGWSLEELQSKPFLEFVHPCDRNATLDEMAKLIGGGRTILFENRYRCQDGSYRWIRWNAHSRSEHRQVYAIAQDITEIRSLRHDILETVDRERERFGRELHDGLCQNLAGIAALSTSLSMRLKRDSNATAEEIGEVARLLSDTIGSAREMARGLNPANLERIGLAAALEALASQAAAQFHISCEFRCDGPALRSGPDVESHLLRIAQEAINNAVTHGRAAGIEISLSFREGTGRLRIRDDGVGFCPETMAERGIGVQTMSFRAARIGGRLEVTRRSRQGTAVTCEFPLPPVPPGV